MCFENVKACGAENQLRLRLRRFYWPRVNTLLDGVQCRSSKKLDSVGGRENRTEKKKKEEDVAPERMRSSALADIWW